MRYIIIFLLTSLLIACSTGHDPPASGLIVAGTHGGYAPPPAPPNYDPQYEEEGGYKEVVRVDPRPLQPASPATTLPKRPTRTVVPDIFDPKEYINQLRNSVFGYSVPDKANIEDEIEVVLIVNPSVSQKDIAKSLGSNSTTGTIAISKVLQARLDSNDFDIATLTPERQVIVHGKDTIWKWTLKPRSHGKNKRVRISVSAVVNVDGERTEAYIDTYTNVIAVEITPKQQAKRWFQSNWQWAWGALLIPAFVYYRSRRKKTNLTKMVDI